MGNEYRRCQVLVVGSGAGGAVVAATLARAGLDVLVLEEGPDVDTSGMATHTPRAMRLLYRNGGLTPIIGKPNIAYVEGRCVGGSTEINSAFWHRPSADIVDYWKQRYRIHDLQAQELHGLCTEIEDRLGVSSLGAKKPPISSELFKAGVRVRGWQAEEIPRAQATDLAGSQFAAGAKSSMAYTYLADARASGARVLSGTRAVRLLFRGGRVGQVRALSKAAGAPARLDIETDVVFVCGGAIQTPLLLRRSGVKKRVGDNLHIHPMLKVAALFDHQIDSHLAPIPVFQVKEFFPEITLGGSVFTPGFLSLTLADNWEENCHVLKQWRRMALYYVACMGSHPGRVRCLPVGGDPLVRYRLSVFDQQNLSVGLARLSQALFAGGATKLYPALKSPRVFASESDIMTYLKTPVPGKVMNLSTVHAFSTCPMGENRDVCVTDSFGRVHGCDNLFLADASIIPDSPGVNPQGTVMALALRNARHLLRERFRR